MIKKLLFAFILVAGFCTVAPAQEVHKPADLMSMMKNSKLSYVMEELYIDINAKDYSGLLNGRLIYREDSDGNLVAKHLKLVPEARQEWDAAEQSFADSNFKDALKHYRNVYDVQSEYYPAKIMMGRIYEKQKDLDKAISSYKQAISKNFVDYYPHQLLAEAYEKQKNFDDAVNEITMAHILNINDTAIYEEMTDVYVYAHMYYDDWAFVPQVKSFKGQNENEIKVLSKPGWTGYAIGKALWQYEPGYAKSQGQVPGKSSELEEKECLLSLLADQSLEKIKTKGTGIGQLQNAQEAKLLDGFIYYEILLHQQPQLVFTMPTSMIKKIKSYVEMAHGGMKVK